MTDTTEAALAVATAAQRDTTADTEPNALQLLHRMEPAINSALAGALETGRFVRVIQTELRRNPELAGASQMTLLAAVVTAAQLALDLTPQLGQAFLVTRRNRRTGETEVSLDIGYRGWVTLALRSALVARVEAHAVGANDDFDATYGTDGFLRHRPARTGGRGDVIAAWAMATFADGGKQWTVLDRDAIDKRRAVSPSYRAARGDKAGIPWTDWEEEMAAKSAIRALIKQLPMTAELASADTADGAVRSDLGTLEEWAASVTPGPEPPPALGTEDTPAPPAPDDDAPPVDDEPPPEEPS